jgi:serine/threonine-protein kinase
LREELRACLPSLVIEHALAPSGQRVVYLARFDDSLIPDEVRRAETQRLQELDPDDPDDQPFLLEWEAWGQVVVKVVSDANNDTIMRLEAEVEVLAELRPANFPKLHYAALIKNNPETDEPLDKRLYVSIEEFIPGNALEAIWPEYIGDEHRIARMALGIANALMPLWVHPQRYVHRDIKPPNILIRPNGEVVVIDLGVIRETGAKGLTQTGYIAPHTPGFAAPEQYKEERTLICFKADFFAIGVVMYQLMFGKNPFMTDPDMDRIDVYVATVRHDPPALSACAGASQAFSDFVEKAMKKVQAERHRTPDIFVSELEALCGFNKN